MCRRSNPSHRHICQPHIRQEARNQWHSHTAAAVRVEVVAVVGVGVEAAWAVLPED